MDVRGVRRAGAGVFSGHPWRLAAAIVLGVLAAAVVTTLVVLAFLDAATAVRASADEDLHAIGRTRAQMVSDWRRERLYDAAAVSGAPNLRDAVGHLVGTGAEDGHTLADTRMMLAQDLELLQTHDAYVGTMLIGRDGKLLATSATEHARMPQETRDVVAEVIASGIPAIGVPFAVLHDDPPQGPFIPERPDRVYMDVVAPVTDATGTVAAAVVLRLDPSETLFRDVLDELRPLDRSHASLLERAPDDGIMEVSPERIGGIPSGDLVDDVALAMAVGGAGSDPDEIYRGPGEDGREVLADVRRVLGSDWVLVTGRDAAEVDAEAANAGLGSLLRVLTVVALMGIVLGGLFLGRQRRLLKQLMRSEHERAIAASRVDDVLTYARDIVLLLDEDGAVLDANKTAVLAYGYDLVALRTLHLADLRAPEERASVARELADARAPGGVTLQTIHQRRDGTTFPVEVSTHALRGPDGLRFESAVRDVRERVEAERALQQQLDELRRWQAGAIGREERILELKAEVNTLLEASGRPIRYASVDQAARVADGR